MPACRCWLVDHRLAADAGSLMISKLASRQAQIHERAGLSVHIKASFWPYMVPRETEPRRKQAGSVHACMRVPIEGATSGHFRPPPPGFAGVSCSSSQLGKTAAQVHTCMETQTSEKITSQIDRFSNLPGNHTRDSQADAEYHTEFRLGRRNAYQWTPLLVSSGMREVRDEKSASIQWSARDSIGTGAFPRPPSSKILPGGLN